jgi:myo-inositol-1(or 4)-monophosphatase
MEGEIGLVVDATRHASKFLLRDYFELENLQSSNRNTSASSFSQKSCTKMLHALQERLGKYFNTVIFDSKELANIQFVGKAALVEVLDGFTNLTRSLPFFAVMVTILSNKDGQIFAEKSVINFPILGEIYFTEKGKGVWLERHSFNFPGAVRTRVSGIENIEDAIVSASLSFLKDKADIFNNLRVFESYTYSLALLISGKIDVIIIEPGDISLMGVQLFIAEAGGVSYKQGKKIVASNFKLHEKIKDIS